MTNEKRSEGMTSSLALNKSEWSRLHVTRNAAPESDPPETLGGRAHTRPEGHDHAALPQLALEAAGVGEGGGQANCARRAQCLSSSPKLRMR